MQLKAKSTWTDVPWYFCDKESYLSWLTFINVAFPYMQQTFFHHIMFITYYLSPSIQKLI